MDVLAIDAHPDDCELFTGGLLVKLSQKGYNVGIVDLTRGELSTRGTPEQRRKEAEASSKILGISTRITLDFGDSRLEHTVENRDALVRMIRELRPQIVLIQYPKDRHPDHVKAARLAQEACFFLNVSKVAPEKERYKPRQIIYYIGNIEEWELKPDFVVDISDTFERKVEALKAFESQFYNPSIDAGETYISSKGYWALIHTRARLYGSMIGVEYGEGFIVDQPLSIEDPVDFFGGRKV